MGMFYEPALTRWVQALKSGKYTQNRGSLRRGDSFCALGVLTDVFHKILKQGEWKISPGEGIASFKLGENFYSGLPPPEVLWWLLEGPLPMPSTFGEVLAWVWSDFAWVGADEYCNVSALNDHRQFTLLRIGDMLETGQIVFQPRFSLKEYS